jgi:hypothetical protein
VLVLLLSWVLALDLAGAASAGVPTRALRGPFPSLSAACARLRGDYRPPMAARQCAFDASDPCGGLARARDVRPFGALQLLRLANECLVAVRVERGWFVGETSLGVGDRHDSGIAAIEPLGTRVVVRTINQYWWHEAAMPYEGWYDRREGLFVCGLVDGVPACTRELVVGWAPRWESEGGDAKPHAWRWRYAASVDGDALIVRRLADHPRVPGSRLAPLAPPSPSPVGRHPLTLD